MDFNDTIPDSEMSPTRYHYVFIHNVYADFFKSTLDYFSTYLYPRFEYRVVGTYDKAVEYLQKQFQYGRETDKPNLPSLVLNPLGEINIADGSSGGKQLWRFPNLAPGLIKRIFMPIYQDANVTLHSGFMRIQGEIELLMLCNSFYEYCDLRMFMLQIFGGNDRWIYPNFFNSFIIIPDEIQYYTYRNEYTGLHYKLDWTSAGASNQLVKSIAKNKMVFPCTIKPIYKLTTLGDNSNRYGGVGDLADWRLTATIQYEVEIPSFLILETDYLAEHISMEIQYGGCYSDYDFTIPANRSLYEYSWDWGLDETSNTVITDPSFDPTSEDLILSTRYIHIITQAEEEQTTNIIISLPETIDHWKHLLINSKDGPLDYGYYWRLSSNKRNLILVRNHINIEAGQVIEIYVYQNSPNIRPSSSSSSMSFSSSSSSTPIQTPWKYDEFDNTSVEDFWIQDIKDSVITENTIDIDMGTSGESWGYLIQDATNVTYFDIYTKITLQQITPPSEWFGASLYVSENDYTITHVFFSLEWDNYTFPADPSYSINMQIYNGSGFGIVERVRLQLNQTVVYARFLYDGTQYRIFFAFPGATYWREMRYTGSHDYVIPLNHVMRLELDGDSQNAFETRHVEFEYFRNNLEFPLFGNSSSSSSTSSSSSVSSSSLSSSSVSSSSVSSSSTSSSSSSTSSSSSYSTAVFIPDEFNTPPLGPQWHEDQYMDNTATVEFGFLNLTVNTTIYEYQVFDENDFDIYCKAITTHDSSTGYYYSSLQVWNEDDIALNWSSSLFWQYYDVEGWSIAYYIYQDLLHIFEDPSPILVDPNKNMYFRIAYHTGDKLRIYWSQGSAWEEIVYIGSIIPPVGRKVVALAAGTFPWNETHTLSFDYIRDQGILPYSSSSSSLSSSSSSYSYSSSSTSSSSSSSYANDFKFTILTTDPDIEFTLPLNDVPLNPHNCTVDWGDGTPKSTITSWNDPDKVHTYATAGEYQIKITGNCPGFFFANSGSPELVKTIDSWGDVGFISLNFSGCNNLTTLPTQAGKLSQVNDFFYFFGNCSSLTAIPSGLFDDNTAVTDFSECFRGCSSLTAIPSGLFDDNIAVNNFAYCFGECSSLTAIPSGLFDNNISVNDFSYCFYGCSSLTAIPSGLFDNNTAVNNFSFCFTFCSSPSLTTIPSGLFDNNIAVTRFSACFSNCSSLTTIPSGLFDNNIAVNNFRGCFYRCTSLTAIPSGLFDNNPDVTDFVQCFRECSSLTAIPSGLFDNNTAVTNFSDCFRSCITISGAVPTLWISHAEANGTQCFKDDTGASNYTEIPFDWGGPL